MEPSDAAAIGVGADSGIMVTRARAPAKRAWAGLPKLRLATGLTRFTYVTKRLPNHSFGNSA